MFGASLQGAGTYPALELWSSAAAPTLPAAAAAALASSTSGSALAAPSPAVLGVVGIELIRVVIHGRLGSPLVRPTGA